MTDLVGQLRKQWIREHHNTHKHMADINTYQQYVISGFCHRVNVAPALLRCYAVFINTMLHLRGAVISHSCFVLH